MRRSTRLIVAAACLITAAGCGSERPPGAQDPPGSGGSGTSGPPGGTTSGPPGPGSPDQPTSSSPRPPGQPGKPTLVKPRGGTERPHPVKFESAKPEAGGRTLAVTWWSGVEPCHVLDRVKVDYSSGSVEITLYEGQDPTQKHRACIEIAVRKRTLVPLRSPLDDRKVVDGAR